MDCPSCGQRLGEVILVRLDDARRVLAARCVSCAGLWQSKAVLTQRGPAPGRLEACASCGTPIETAGQLECTGCTLDPGGFPPDSEAGARLLGHALRTFPLLPASPALEYFEEVLDRLVSSTRSGAAEYSLLAVSQLGSQVLSVPGGRILAGEDFLTGFEDEAMLAFALARQIGHQFSGRVARRFRVRRASVLAAGVGWGLRLLKGAEPSFAFREESSRLAEVVALGYGPALEESADAYAIDLIGVAGYDVSSAVRFLDGFERREAGSAAAIPRLPARGAPPRRRQLAEALSASAGRATELPRVDREVYRRAAENLVAERVRGAGSSPPAFARSAARG